MTDTIAPPFDIQGKVAAMDEAELLSRRQELQALGRSPERRDGLLEHELEEICAIYARLRTKKATTPKTAAAITRRAKNININDLPL